MGAAKRRKLAGTMPELSPKLRTTARIKPDPRNIIVGWGIGGLSTLMGSLMMHGRTGELFAIRNEMARMNREKEVK